jgi:PAS domain S-box-containing protein
VAFNVTLRSISARCGCDAPEGSGAHVNTTAYEYTPYVWPMLVAAGTLGGLAVYSLRRRSMPGALPFAMMTLLALLWALGAAMEIAAVDKAAKVFWIKFHSVWDVPLMSAGLWFALDYANLNRLLTRRALGLLAVPPLLLVLLVLTNDSHRLIWRGFALEGEVQALRGPASWVFIDYGLVLGVATSLIFVWLFLRSPLHRWPAAFFLAGYVIHRTAYMLDIANANPVAPVDPTMLVAPLVAGMYAVALFQFRMFDLAPVAYGTIVEQIREGVLVLDRGNRIADLNRAAEKILGIAAGQVRGRQASQALAAHRGLAAWIAAPPATPFEMRIGTGADARHYSVRCSPLRDRGGSRGYLVLLYDLTIEKRADALLVERQRVLATFSERDRVARELHDSLGQVLGFLKMQAQAARQALVQGRPYEAEAYLTQLVAAAQEAHVDVREFIVGARAGVEPNGPFLSTLECCLQRFRDSSGIRARLVAPPELAGHPFEPMVAAQLLPIIQEALTNVRKHAGAREVEIRLTRVGGRAEAIVRDDGTGFDPAMLDTDAGQRFGLHFMRERAEGVGGTVQVRSAPGQGTEIVIQVPVRKEAA